jgi:hypothetical protein
MKTYPNPENQKTGGDIGQAFKAKIFDINPVMN